MTKTIQSGVQTNNPIAVELTRGGIVECTHRASVAIVDTAGKVVRHHGNVESPIFPRSAIKIFQAMPMVESGAADVFKLTPQELALTCASHNGEKKHAHTSECMLHKMGLGEPDLECGCHKSSYLERFEEMIRDGETLSQLHNNCSGKHAGMLALAKQKGWDIKGYVKQTHPVQQSILGNMEMMMGCDMSDAPVDVDGCSAPAWAVPLKNMAYAFAQVADPSRLPTEKEHAVRTLRDAVTANPYYVGGTKRFDTDVMDALGDKAFIKVGAMAVHGIALPEYGLGVAIKVDSGLTQASQTIAINIMEQIGVLDGISEGAQAKLDPYLEPVLKNHNGITFGSVRFKL